MSRRNRKPKNAGWYSDRYFQSGDYNQRVFIKYLMWLESLAINRWRWVGLPDSCDARYLEQALIQTGMATIAHDKNAPDVWLSLKATVGSDLNMYGIPTRWRALGENGTQFDVTGDNGVLVYDTQTRVNCWNYLTLFARKLTHYERTEDINLMHQQTPFALVAPREKRMEIVNIFKQLSGGEPAILGDESFGELVDNIKAIKTDVPFIAEELNIARRNVINDALMFLGIPHLAFEKGERMIEDEARANTAPTEISLMDGLTARRAAADYLNERFGMDIQVYFNTDWESYNYNYLHNIEAVTQDGADGSGDIVG